VVFVLSLTTCFAPHVSAADGRSTPATFDIVGLKPGMSATTAEQQLHSNDPAMRIVPITGRLATGQSYKQGVRGLGPVVFSAMEKNAPLSKVISEDIIVLFTHTAPQQVFYVGRAVWFKDSERPLLDRLAAQLIEKYGLPSGPIDWQSRAASMHPSGLEVHWSFDVAGRQYDEPAHIVPSLECIQLNGSGTELPRTWFGDIYPANGYRTVVYWTNWSPKCSIALDVSISTLVGGVGEAISMQQELGDHRLALRDVQADADAASEKLNASRARLRQLAGPKL
jgi:hypothetical protein